MNRFITARLHLHLSLPREPRLCVKASHQQMLRQSYRNRNFSKSSRAIGAMAKEYKLKNVSGLSLQPGDKQEVEVEGVDDAKVLLVNAAGSIQALGSRCTHYGAPLVNGVLTKEGRLTCPWHGGRLSCTHTDTHFLVFFATSLV